MSTDSASSGSGRSLYLVVICLVAALGGLLFGFDTAVISGTVGLFKAEFRLSDTMEGWVASSALVGCFFGALAAGMMSDRFGRKKILLLAAFFFTVSALWCGLARTATDLVLARLIGGLGIGIASLVSPLYIAEISPPHIRGRLVALQQLAIVLGILGAFFSNSLILHASLTEDAKWRWMFAIGAFPAAVFLVLILPVPESPRWLAKQGLQEKARAILTRVVGAAEAEVEMTRIMEAIAHEGGRFRELFKPGIRRALFVGVTLMILTQVTGINAIMYYAPEVFKQAGSGAAAAYSDTVWIGLTNLVFTLLSMAVVDRLGRKPLLLIGSTCMGLALFCVGYAFHVSSMFTPNDFQDLPGLATRLGAGGDPLGKFLRSQMPAETVKLLDEYSRNRDLAPGLRSALAKEFNQVLKTNSLYETSRFAGVNLSQATRTEIEQKPQGQQLVRLNRALLQEACPGLIAPKANHKGTMGLPLLLGVLAYVGSFAFSMGVVGWVLVSEIYPTRTRGRAMSVATGGVWGACYLVSQTFPMLRDRAGLAVTFWTYGALCVVAVLFVLAFVPETKGRPLEEIEKSW
jgi:MFS transporter, SP family, arabinose:H+ symporter